jgi:hypothetical protein
LCHWLALGSRRGSSEGAQEARLGRRVHRVDLGQQRVAQFAGAGVCSAPAGCRRITIDVMDHLVDLRQRCAALVQGCQGLRVVSVFMTTAGDSVRAHALVDELFGPSDEVADRAVWVLHAHAAALAWVRDMTGSYPAPASVAAVLAGVAERLRTGGDERDPVAVLGPAAVDALAAYRATSAA